MDALGSSVPVWGISDADPYGLEIMATYKFGSQAFLHMSDQLQCRCLVALGR
jgi:DNA topoisomerase VI subunit A